MKNEIIIIDNFLTEEEFITFCNPIIRFDFPWHFSPTMTPYDPKSTPGFFVHIVYDDNVTNSLIYTSFSPILKRLNVAILSRIQLNLNCRLPESYSSPFHTDTEDILDDDVAAKWSVSIFYINTNNGYTELEDGTKIESVANRMVTFPSNTRHRMVTQTDEQTRILINFNYLKMKTI